MEEKKRDEAPFKTIQVDIGLLNHKKTRRLAEILNIERSIAFMIVTTIWSRAAGGLAPNGDLSGTDPDDWANFCYWPKNLKGEKVFKAMEEVGFIKDMNLNNWYEHQYVLNKRESTRKTRYSPIVDTGAHKIPQVRTGAHKIPQVRTGAHKIPQVRTKEKSRVEKSRVEKSRVEPPYIPPGGGGVDWSQFWEIWKALNTERGYPSRMFVGWEKEKLTAFLEAYGLEAMGKSAAGYLGSLEVGQSPRVKNLLIFMEEELEGGGGGNGRGNAAAEEEDIDFGLPEAEK